MIERALGGGFIATLEDFVTTIFPFDISSVIIVLVGIILALAAWRIVS